MTRKKWIQVLAAFAAVYIIWGSTYLAMRFVMDTLPDFAGIGLRFLIAGTLLYLFAWSRGRHRATLAQWRGAAIVGLLLLVGGTGAIVWAMQSLESGLAALLAGMEPLWLAVLMWVWPGVVVRPGFSTFAALGLGFAGVAILAAPGDVFGREAIEPSAVLVLTLASISWAAGSLLSRNIELPASPWATSAIQMLSGGVTLLVFGTLRGEWTSFDPAEVSALSAAAFVYLIVFGSLIAFSAYSWLIRTIEPTLVATHTYVNPVVAIFLGWWLADEAVGPRTLVAAALILSSVVILTGAEADKARRAKKAAQRAAGSLPGQMPARESIAEKCT